MKFKLIFCLFFLAKALPSWSCQRDTIRLFYDINQKELTPAHKVTLDSLSRFIKDTTVVKIHGFADYLGKRDSNFTLSTARADLVKAYLQKLHSKSERLFANGKGQIDASTKAHSAIGDPFNRRVEIIFARPALPKPALKKPIIIVPRSRDTARLTKKNDSVYTRINNIGGRNVGDSISFSELTFQPGRHFLRPSAVRYMVALKELLKAHPNLKIEIQGHICCQYNGKDGEDFDTRKFELSLTRAKFIYDYLVSEGISPNRLTYKGLGSKEPKVYPEMSSIDQDQNRRVVIVLTGK
ncbi:OmpA family protein [Mucilaginibacter gotjawali]|uniref:Outer membrane protein OmpA-like peptidoglycan-associated protein n=2 Tax=Mucilaginibacter gotjawali TaxID=1550579 RepID=A0A839SHS2_9SPHI|nr:OmpA family protein [Mucilaginibacter gotjawali]MBB3057851.1 outer membrane protein OmpA-like peptidoglycan-associated protein [Mucilaginibacter gotjawali]BAU52377.1 flagellar motor protein MotD [Mucilaginibacter gotjawali]